ncbi:MAG: SDR family NAD(P)-dependent oxidoreductase [Lysobacter sp.]|nr:SDR family NAD(P)-dependent oxidoreductase [Lysobacter sp.]
MQADAGLQDKAETYLKALIVDAQPALTMDFDGGTAFGELGIDSFRVLKLIKRLESDFGTLPKTLLFEHFNVESLAGWLVQRHAPTLHRLFDIATMPSPPVVAASSRAIPAPPAVEKVSSATESIGMPPVASHADLSAATNRVRSPSPAMPMLLLERDLPAHPELQATLAGLYERHRNEGSVSRGTRNIAPNLFVGSTRRGYFNYGRCGDAILVYAYTGPDDAFAELAEECLAHCRRHGLQLNLFMDAPVTDIAGVSFSSTPFGVLQRVNDLKSFSLEGGAMRRLRYQVGKFEKAGACDTREYACGSDAAVDREIAAIIDRWCEARPMVNPLIHIVREEILAGSLHPQHRIFLTRLDGVLQNVILISKVSDALNGYLMDLEFYPREMPLGGLEFAIVRIIETLVAEGCDLFSLGGTYGVRLETSPHADPAVDAVLDALHSQGIFNDEGNLQFKNKFRPENRTIYLCRPADGSPADNIVDIIMMIADPDRQTPDTEHHHPKRDATVAPVPVDAVAAVPVEGQGGPVATPRLQALEAAGFNPMNLAASEVDHDLKTDSWAQLDSPSIAALMAQLRAQLQRPVDVAEALADVFPFAHVALADSGRSAEHVLCKAWPRRGRVLQNLLFPTCLYHQLDKGFEPVEIPHPALFSAQDAPDRAGLDLDALRAALAADAAGIACVCIELADNAAGGLPVSPAHLREVRTLIEPHRIPLVVDATRVVENALQLIDQRPEYAGHGTWDLVRETLALADVAYASLCKDFCVDRGGLIATNDASLADRFRHVLDEDGGGLDVIERRLVGLALRQKDAIEGRCRRRMAAVRTLWTALHAEGVPVFAPAGGHCVLVDVAAMPAFAALPHPVPAFAAWLYLATGIRAGAHSVGMQSGTSLNGLVRLALPVGLEQAQVDDLVARVIRAVRELRDIPELVPASGVPAVGDVHAAHALARWHRRSAVVASPALAAASPAVQAGAANAGEASLPATIAAREAPAARTLRQDEEIAVVGIGGRYPGAHGMAEFWDVLREGRDCITDLPRDRLDKRLKHPFTRSYRGGFIDAIDRFDSLFFNISPREAEVLDPQERLFLEVAWETLEDAGYHPEMLAQDPASRDVGVFVGAVWAMYQMVGAEQKLVGRDLNSNSFLWSISNRVSYWMNFSGPSLTVDTACSSSLTALHLACEAIRNGTCSSAIVGGVNLDLHQHKFDINHGGGALSPDGLCRAFGEGANGYVAGEGVGALYLKPLSRAIEDRDQIYGLIRGTMVNHGGRTSGYTVPNPKAQGDLVAAALAKSGVDARSIGYIEAHGTGTELGDPIEIAGLVSAFERDAVPLGSCPIGSVKTNIGHLEAAAGVVGVTKALLQIRHRQLVPSLHSARPNPHIDFADTPFVVQQALAPWPAKQVDGRTLPLRAGISSFGAGGANAHVVVESFDAPQAASAASGGDHVFPLSARTEEQLREMARRLRADLQRDAQAGGPRELVDIAFTLQEGRKSFEHRMAVVAASLRDLVAGLGAFLEGRSDTGVLVGHAKNAEGVTRLLGRDEKAQFIALLAQGRDPRRLAQLWIDGLLSDCRGFLSGGRRVSLPTYPFADKRHWIAPTATAAAPLIGARPGLHPLLDSNESTFQRQLFRKSFRAGEFVLADHRVSGVPTLPGTAYLEMARIAGELATGRRVRKVRNITWISPLSAEGDAVTEAIVELRPVSGEVMFEVFSEAADGKRRLFAQGKLVFAATDEGEAPSEYVDLQAIRSRSAKVIDGRDAYPLFRSVGMDYGPSFQVLQEVFRSDSEVLGLLRLPDVRQADFDAFVFHPCLLDASMQAGVAGQLGDAGGEMKVPYSIGEVEWLHPFTPVCYSIVTKMQGDRSGGGGLSRENVDIVDADGRVLARIRESVGVPLTSVHDKSSAAPRPSQAVAPVASTPVDAAGDVFEPLFYTPQWLPAPLVAGAARDDVSTVLLFDVDSRLRDSLATKHCRVVLAVPGDGFARRGEDLFALDPRDRDGYDRLLAALDAKGVVPDRICFAWPSSRSVEAADSDAAIDAALDTGVYALLFLCQALAERKLKSAVRLLCLRTADDDAADPGDPLDEALNGFARSVRLESPKLECKLLTVPRSLYASGGLCALVKAELDSGSGQDIAVRHRDGLRTVRTLARLPSGQVLQGQGGDIALRQRGVYVITGGAGGLGLIFADYLARECQARLVLSGRSALPPEREAQLDALRALGAEVHYVAADVSRRDDVDRLLAETRTRFGRVDGIVHSAGVLRDSFFWKKRREDMAAVLAPKVHGTLHLDAATRADDLDFFVLFSSLAAFGNAGQCDYGYANSYLDAFAARREFQRARGERRGRTLSLNWSLWADGGMKLDEQTELFFRTRLGIKPLGTDFGLRAFVSGLACDVPQLAVVEGVVDKVETAWGLRGPAANDTSESEDAPQAASGGEGLEAVVIDALAGIVMEMLKVSEEDLSLDGILLDLGFDSIGLTTFANEINGRYGLEINPVMFFEYPSIRAIAGVMATEHAAAVARVHAPAASPGNAVAAAAPVAAVQATPSPAVALPAGDGIDKGWQPDRAPVAGPASVAAMPDADFRRDRRFVDMPIAIVGMAGVMPQSDNVEAFWENLRDARNLVTEIPRDRWIWEEYDGNPIKETNKSNSRWGGFLRDVDKFDPLFFGITPREAEMMDPQQRIFIETVWSAIEDSGHKVSDLSGTRTGLFVGVSAKDYIDVLAENQSSLDGFSASGNSHSILANRVSFLLNLRGPSAPLDTACSSSLIALHRAIESIHTGSSDMAIVGGVQVMLTPVGHISLSSAGMLSVDGKCKTFDKDANGYVRGEGAGAIFIKTLADAIRDGNPIHAVIRATAENHGGRVTMLTAPNPKAQAELLFEAYDKGEVDPTTVGYIECHGTGTSLGDPIEIQALKKSFADLYRRRGVPPPAKPHCGLSSVKTNIGHLEPAAGIASLLKALMAIRHRQIPALLHFETLNPYIDLDGSPFYIADRTVDWDAPRAADGSELPRVAGVSSFGWGGANAHVVIEEYRQPERAAPASVPLPVVLSAKNEARLRDYARVLLAHLRRQPALAFADLAYTLQVGRDPMEERLAVMAASVEELAGKLDAFLDGDSGIDGVHRGRVSRYKRNEQGLSVPGGDDAGAARIAGWLSERAYPQLAAAWAEGGDVDWRALHAGDGAWPARRISLPTYPFARDRHWIETRASAKPGAVAAALHPLVHANTSTLERHRYTTRFTGREPLLVDHARTLPAAACLEMARAAVALALGLQAQDEAGRDAVIELTDMRWHAPHAGSGMPLHVELRAGRGGAVDCEIHGQDEAAATARVVHASARALRGLQAQSPRSRLDVQQLRALMRDERLEAAALDAAVDRLQPMRGPSLRSIRDYHLGHRQALARLAPPPGLEQTGADAMRTAVLLDGALQCAAILVDAATAPSSLAALRQFKPCTGELHAWARRSAAAGPGEARVDIDLIDAEGTVCMRLEGLVFAVQAASVGVPGAERRVPAPAPAMASPEDFATLLDALYRPAADPSGTTGPDAATDAEFEKMLEEIL